MMTCVTRGLTTWGVMMCLCGTAVGEYVVLTDDFETGINGDWTASGTATTPSGRRFLGPFGRESVSLTVEMPASERQWARVSFDVYAIGSWSSPVISLLVDQYLPSTSWQPAGGIQMLTASDLHNFVRRIEVDTLGYGEGDRVYHFDTFLTGNEEWYRIDWNGNASGMQWGIDNIRVTAAVFVPEPSTWALLAIAALLFTAIRVRYT